MNDAAFAPLPAAEIERLAACFPERVVAIGEGAQVSVRECGTAENGRLPLVCLHGIGSGAASWLDTAILLSRRTRVIAWDAPGYGQSDPLPMDAPRAIDYAKRLHLLLDALKVPRCVLVGHSLGALMAVAALREAAAQGRYAGLMLISPAQGYGAPARADDRERVRTQRLESLDRLGVAGIAAQRSSRLVSEHASPVALAWVRWTMAQLNEHGYRQAVELLCNGDLLADLPPAAPVQVACGDLDAVTPPAACAEVARRCGVALQTIARAGHASHVEQPAAVVDLLARALDEAGA